MVCCLRTRADCTAPCWETILVHCTRAGQIVNASRARVPVRCARRVRQMSLGGAATDGQGSGFPAGQA